ncbi:MAG: hypothetical protein ACRERU_04545 [Methylococcales bacterium]
MALNDAARIDVTGDRNGGTVLVGGGYRGQGAMANARLTTVVLPFTNKS